MTRPDVADAAISVPAPNKKKKKKRKKKHILVQPPPAERETIPATHSRLSLQVPDLDLICAASDGGISNSQPEKPATYRTDTDLPPDSSPSRNAMPAAQSGVSLQVPDLDLICATSVTGISISQREKPATYRIDTDLPPDGSPSRDAMPDAHSGDSLEVPLGGEKGREEPNIQWKQLLMRMRKNIKISLAKFEQE
jgi:hypothetical protein